MARDKKENKEYVLQIRMTHADRELLELHAAEFRMSLSAWARWAMFNAANRKEPGRSDFEQFALAHEHEAIRDGDPAYAHLSKPISKRSRVDRAIAAARNGRITRSERQWLEAHFEKQRARVEAGNDAGSTPTRIKARMPASGRAKTGKAKNTPRRTGE